MKTIFHFSVSKDDKRAWRNYLQSLPSNTKPTKVGENDFYEFYETIIDGDVERRVWSNVIRTTGLKGIYVTTKTLVDDSQCVNELNK